MNSSELCDLPVVDCHVHFINIDSTDKMLEIIKKAGLKRMNLLSVAAPMRLNFNPEEIYVKAVHPNLFYAFGGLDYSSAFLGSAKAEPSLTKQVDTLTEIGFDGIKMIEGKPFSRKIFKTPLNSEFYREYFEYVESLQFPILSHVNDPEEFWDPEQIPPSAKAAGWFYDETYPKKEELYAEVSNVLRNCPDLKVIFAHFYFLSGDLERASRLLEEYKNVHLDITPGSEMYYNFSARREDWREFFIRYQNRIFFGTDISDRSNVENAVNHVRRIRRFLETDEPITWGTYPKKKEPLIGFKLPKHVLGKIYAENFERIVDKKPRKLNLEAAISECQRIARIIKKIDKVELAVTLPKWIASEKNTAKHIANILKKHKG